MRATRRLTISDGEYYIPAMLATQLNGMILNNEVERFSIVRLDKYLCNSVHERKYVPLCLPLTFVFMACT